MRIVKLLAVCLLLCPMLVLGQNLFLGKWKFNAQRSKFFGFDVTKDEVVTFEAVGDKIKRFAIGTMADGSPINQAGIPVAWDGKDHPLDDKGMTAAISLISDHEVKAIIKQNGKLSQIDRLVISEDGKTMSTTARGKNSKGKMEGSDEFYQRIQ